MNEQDILEQMLIKLQTLLDLANQDSEYCKTNLREHLRPLDDSSLKTKDELMDELMQAVKEKFINSEKLQDIKNRIVSLIHYLNLAEETANRYESLKASFMKSRDKNVRQRDIDNSLLEAQLTYLLLILGDVLLNADLLYSKIDLKDCLEDKNHPYNTWCQLRRNLRISFCRDNARNLLEKLDKIPVLLETCETCKELSAEKVGGDKNDRNQNQK